MFIGPNLWYTFDRRGGGGGASRSEIVGPVTRRTALASSTTSRAALTCTDYRVTTCTHLAAFTRSDTIMNTGSFVAAYLTVAEWKRNGTVRH